jgi:hypothetical protein
MAKKDQGVLLEPVVRKHMDQFFDGYGNGRNAKQYSKGLGISRFQAQPNPFMKTITYRALVKSEYPRDPNNATGSANRKKKPSAKRFITYLVTVRFHEVEFSDEQKDKFNQEYEVAGRTQYAVRPSIKKNKVMIRCQCRDFMMTWERPVALKGGLWPNNVWTKYKRKTNYNPMQDPSPVLNPPYRNPDEKMGICKHLQNLLDYLVDNDIINYR